MWAQLKSLERYSLFLCAQKGLALSFQAEVLSTALLWAVERKARDHFAYAYAYMRYAALHVQRQAAIQLNRESRYALQPWRKARTHEGDPTERARTAQGRDPAEGARKKRWARHDKHCEKPCAHCGKNFSGPRKEMNRKQFCGRVCAGFYKAEQRRRALQTSEGL